MIANTQRVCVRQSQGPDNTRKEMVVTINVSCSECGEEEKKQKERGLRPFIPWGRRPGWSERRAGVHCSSNWALRAAFWPLFGGFEARKAPTPAQSGAWRWVGRRARGDQWENTRSTPTPFPLDLNTTWTDLAANSSSRLLRAFSTTSHFIVKP
jgi:hypothetical protein